MTVKHLRIFIMVCETGSVTEAGKQLYMAQPAISLAIAELENYYGVKLFDRISRRMHITESGRQLLQYATHIVSMFDEAEQRIKNDDFAGILRVGSSITVGSGLLPDCLERMRDAYPHAIINVMIDTSKQIEEGILRNTLDIGIIEGIIHDKYIISEPICDDSLCFICAPQHRFAGKTEVDPDEMLKEVLILREEGSAAREMFDIQLGSMGKKATPSWQSVSNSAIISAVRSNLGISILPSMLVRGALEEGSLKCFLVEGVRLSRKFKIIYHKNKFLSKVQTEFIRICREAAVGTKEK